MSQPTVLLGALLLLSLGLAVALFLQRRLHGLFRSSFDGDGEQAVLLILSPSGRMIVNKRAEALFDLNEPRLDAWLGGLDPDAAESLRRLIDEARSGHGAIVELTHPDPVEEAVWRVAVDPIPSRRGACRVAITPITNLRRRDEALREEQRRLVDLMDRAPLGIYSVDARGRFLFANATLGEWLGIAPRRLVKERWRLHDLLETRPPLETPPHLPFWGEEEGSGLRAVFQDGRGNPLPVALHQSLVTDESGRLERTHSVVEDVRNQRAMQQALAASEQRFRRVFFDAPVAIALLDRDLKIIDANPALSRLTNGIDATALKGKPLLSLIDPDDGSAVTARLKQALTAADTGSAFVSSPLQLSLAGEAQRAGELHVSPLEPLDGSGQPALMVQVIDLTERRSLEQQFAQSQKMQAIGQLAGGIAHDFNNLLTAMIGYCDLLLLRHGAGDPSFADIMQVKQNADRAAGLTRQLLAFSRRQTLKPRILDVGMVLSDVDHLVRRLLGERINLKIIHGRSVGAIKVDQGQLEQVLVNLAVNARDAMPGGGSLILRSRRVVVDAPLVLQGDPLSPGDYVVLDAEDTGSGIDAENLGRIFEPFFTTKPQGAGTGLGLATVYGIVRQFNGDIAVESEVGRGTVFSIYLPAQAAQTGAAERTGRSEAAEPIKDLTGQGVILLVEDEDPVRAFASRALRNKGYEVVEAADGEEALERFDEASGRFDLLVTDMVMPGIGGEELVATLLDRNADLKVICVSGYAEDSGRETLGNSEDIRFLPKPFTLKQLAAEVKEMLMPPST